MQSEIEYEVIFHFVIAISHVVGMKLEVKEKVKNIKLRRKKHDFMMRKSKKKLVVITINNQFRIACEHHVEMSRN